LGVAFQSEKGIVEANKKIFGQESNYEKWISPVKMIHHRLSKKSGREVDGDSSGGVKCA
jgi:hypothetical protein